MSYEQYVAMFEDHIEKRAPNLREPASSSDDETGSPRKRSRKPVTPKTPSKKDEEDAKSQAAKSNMTKTGTDFGEIKNLKNSIPESCHISFNKKLKIEKLDANFRLCMHPFPLVDGELILFQPNSEDNKGKEDIIIRDYSLVKRMENAPKPSTASVNKKKRKKGGEKEEVVECKLQCLE